MASGEYIQLPVIDFSLLNYRDPNTRVWESVKTEVFQALQEYGCFQAIVSGVSPELQNSVYDAMKELFDLPFETKSKNTASRMFHGFIGNTPILPLYESMGIDEPYIEKQVENFTNLMWPQGNAQVCEDIHLYSNKLFELDAMVMKMVFESLDLGPYFNEYMELKCYTLKLMKYRVPKPNESDLGLHAHADSGIMTILHQNDVEGLEIQMKDDKWFKVKLSPHLFTVMVAETLNVWLNRRLHVPYHRVFIRENKTRFSLGLFALPKVGKLMKTMEEMVDEEHPLSFKSFDYDEFIKFLFRGGQGKEKYAVKAYCSVLN
ncbi:probable 2-oxoglutarate-dependent dioxygenase AOP1 [Lactuca sativa]|uniref:probable 2-oxoglutarate-dependent dioxygenase AOP1 n=1 Tax=Lactuca sativa TaxID=4236 RepID=UPI000CD9386D|nr:probable 2-oxoglutarate-dependent dioxygenase AOP1 [Lactuca sativa]